MKKYIYIGISALLIASTLGVYSYVVKASDSGALSPGTMADDATVGTVAWSNPDNAKVSDNVYATAVLSNNFSHYLKATNFGFTIPTGATINGIVVEIEGYLVVTSGATQQIKIIKGGTVRTTRKTTTFPEGAVNEAYNTVGSSSDLWGLSWTAEDINASNFGMVFYLGFADDTPAGTWYVDHIRITVYYTNPITSLPSKMSINSGTLKVNSGTLQIQ